RTYIPGLTSEQSRLFAFVLPKQGPVQLVDFHEYEPVADAVRAWRAAAKDQRFPSADVLKVLREHLAAPLEKAIGQAKFVLYSPDGAVGQIPFAALPGAKSGELLLDRWAFVS